VSDQPPSDPEVPSEGVVVNHTGLCVTDLDRARRFYVEVLGFVVDRELSVPDEATAALLGVGPPANLTAVYLQRGPFVLELLHFDRDGNPAAADRPFNAPGLTHLSFSVDDLDATIARVPDAGGEVVTRLPGVAMVRDPDGQLLELLPMSYHRSLT
jgi:catechol 2,3-dioxygenase-like lactoylglutathione lyase family enzyme